MSVVMNISEYIDVQSAMNRLKEIDLRDVWETVASHRWAAMATVVGAYVGWRLIRRPNLPPGPWGIPVLGAVQWMQEDILPQRLLAARQKYGDVVCFNVGIRPYVFLSSYEAIMEAFVRRGEDFAARPEESDAMLRNLGLISEVFTCPYNEKWKAHKKFAISAYRSFGFGTPKSEATIQKQLDQLEAVLLAADGAAVDTTAWFHRVAAGIATLIHFGAQYSWDDPQIKELVRVSYVVSNDLNESFSMQYLSMSFPIWFWRIVCWLAMGKTRKSFSDGVKFMKDRIDEHRRTLDPQNPRDVLDVYLIERHGDPDLNDNILAGNMLAVLPDAIDSIPKLMNWVLLYVTSHPEVQKRLHALLDAVCGSSRRPGLVDRPRLAYIEAIVLEVTRVTNFVPSTPPRAALRDTTFRGYTIPKGTPIIANFYAVHFDPEVHPEPTVFNPDRFLDAEGKLTNVGKVLTFSVGRRMCMGESMVKVELFLLVARLFHRFKLQFPDNQPSPTLEGKPFSFPAPFLVRVLPR